MKPICIGLTGTIASGKTTVSELFAAHGIDIISADAISKDLTSKHSPAIKKIVHHFGQDILDKSGNLNRPKLRQLIMKNQHERQWLENLLHPMIRNEIKTQIKRCKSAYCIIEIPLLNSKKHFAYLDRVLVVTSEPNEQIPRIMKRDDCSQEDAARILEMQTKNNQREKLADDRLNNSGDINMLRQQVDELHARYLRLT